MTISVAYFYDEDNEAEGENVDIEWVDGLWERRGWMGSLQSFTKLKRLEIPLPVLLGWKPDFQSKKLRDVLPRHLKELCLRDDLVDLYEGGTYPWTPWDSDLQYDLDILFEKTVDCSPVITQLKDYLTPSTLPQSDVHPALEMLILKQIQGRYWPQPDVCEVSQLCREAEMTGILLGQATNWGDEVLELTVHDPSWTIVLEGGDHSSLESDHFLCRYLRLPRRKTFCHRYCKTTSYKKIKRSFDWWPWQ